MIKPLSVEQTAKLDLPLPTSAQDARVAVTEFLLDHLGNQLIAGQPHLMVSFLQATWIVPVDLAYIHRGSIGSVGVVAVDAETAQVIAWTPIAQMKAASRALRQQHEPALSAEFERFMQPTQAQAVA